MIKIEHIAIWVENIEISKEFYSKYFNATAGQKYFNPTKNFTSYFLSFENGARLELMHKPDFRHHDKAECFGLAHFAVSLGIKENVLTLTETFRTAGHIIFDEPRTTGDGYFESVILDPDGNKIELTI